MNKKTALVISTVIAANILFYTTLKGSGVNAYDISSEESVSQLSFGNVKKEEILSSILKPDVPDKFSLEIDSYNVAIEKIKKDLKEDINIPSIIESQKVELNGEISRGVGIALYKLDDKDISIGRFVPNNDNLISDSKFTVSSKDGSFRLPFKKDVLKDGDHIGICISYSVQNKDSKVLNKTYVIDSIYKVGNSVEDKKEDTETNLRISGKNRFETNIESINRNFKPENVKTLIITSGFNFADPLAAGPLAMKIKAPIIFSGNNGLNNSALDFISKSKPEKVIIIGGENTVPLNVEKQLSSYKIERIAGKNRYETSTRIAKKFGRARHVILTDGRNFADALSATPLAKKISAPVILVRNIGSIPDNIDEYNDAYIIGGRNSVSSGIEMSLKNIMSGKNVYRIYGKNRSETSVQVANLVKFSENILVNGNSFADALSSINMLEPDGKNLLLLGIRMSNSIKELTQEKVNYVIGGFSTVSKEIIGY